MLVKIRRISITEIPKLIKGTIVDLMRLLINLSNNIFLIIALSDAILDAICKLEFAHSFIQYSETC